MPQLKYCCHHNRPVSLNKLLKKIVNLIPDRYNKFHSLGLIRFNCFIYSCEGGHLPLAKTFHINSISAGLEASAQHGHWHVIEYLCNGSVHNRYNNIILEGAVRGGQMDIIKKIDLEQCDLEESLKIACARADRNITNLLLDHTVGDEVDNHELYVASCQSGDVEFIKYIEERLNYTPSSNEITRCLHSVASSGKEEALMYLLNRCNVSNIPWFAVIDGASNHGDVDNVKKLIQNMKKDKGTIPNEIYDWILRTASSEGHLELCKYAIDNDATDTLNGFISAVEQSHLDVAKYLADYLIPNDKEYVEYMGIREFTHNIDILIFLDTLFSEEF